MRTASLRALAIAFCAATALAQCDPTLAPTGPVGGSDANVRALGRWDPDGPGPLGEQLVVAGDFRRIGALATNVALYDVTTDTWTALPGLGGRIYCSTVTANGDLLVGGQLPTTPGPTYTCIAHWTGAGWQTIGGTFQPQPAQTPTVSSLATLPNGDLVAGGSFRLGSGPLIQNLARFDGASWSAFGDPVTSFSVGSVSALLQRPNGDLIVTGQFTSIAGLAAESVAVYDGANWTVPGVPTGQSILSVFDATMHANGDLIVAAIVSQSPGFAGRALRWDGATWSTLPGLSWPSRLATSATGDVIASGALALANGESARVARWTGSAWQRVGTAAIVGNVTYDVTELPNGDLVVAGDFDVVAPVNGAVIGAGNLVRFDGTDWAPLVAGTDGAVRDVVALGAGRHLAVGAFRAFAGTPAHNLAVFDAGSWTGRPMPIPESEVFDAVRRLDGTVAFATREPGGSARLYQWFDGPGAGMLPLGVAPGSCVLDVLPDGDLVVGSFTNGIGASAGTALGTSLARRDVATGAWSPVAPGFFGSIRVLCALPDGGLVVAGNGIFDAGTSLGAIALWDGASWDTLAGGLDAAPSAIARHPDGGFVAVGRFTTAGGAPANGVARWDGTQWSTYGAGFPTTAAEAPRCVAVLPTRDVLVGGGFTTAGGVAARHLARWDGASWQPIGAGTDGPVDRIDVGPGGEVVFAGDFLEFDGQTSAYVAALEPPCAAASTAPTTGTCGVAGNSPQLLLDEAPWVGGSMRSRVVSMPSGSIGLTMWSLPSPAFQLSILGFPSSQSCWVLAVPELATLFVPSAGGDEFAVAIPDQPNLTGVVLTHQAASFAFAANGSVQSLAATNAFRLTIGDLW